MKNKDEIITYNYKNLNEVDKEKIDLMKKVVERALSDNAIKEYFIDCQIHNTELSVIDFASYAEEKL